MRRPFALLVLASLLLAAAPDARADGQNDRLRRSSGRRSTSTADDGRSSSSDSSSSDSCGTFCNLVASCLDVASLCSIATSPGPTTVIVVDGGSTRQVVPDSSDGSLSGTTAGPYGLPQGPADPWRGLLVVGLQRALSANFLVVPRVQAHLDLPLHRQALRLGFEHQSLLEWVPTEAGEAGTEVEHWDHLPMSTLRLGWIFRQTRWEVGLLAGIRRINLGSGGEPGVDLGMSALYESDTWFLDFGALGIAFENLVAIEPWVRGGLALGPLQLGVGWRHLHFFDGGVVPYSGPEITVALRF